MSEQNGKVCSNCRHCKREKMQAKADVTHLVCEVDGYPINYIKSMTGWCRHWAKEKKDGKE